MKRKHKVGLRISKLEVRENLDQDGMACSTISSQAVASAPCRKIIYLNFLGSLLLKFDTKKKWYVA
jgi:hypothetical protein